jgi:hypothetical protein
MAISVKNVTRQRLPIIIPDDKESREVILPPQKTVVLALDEPTSQLNTLKKKGMVKIK